MKSRIPLLLALCVLLTSCGGGEEQQRDPRQALYDAAVRDAREGHGHLQESRGRVGHEAFLRAYDRALKSLRAEGHLPPRGVILSLLSNICLGIGHSAPNYLGRGLRFAEDAMKESPSLLEPVMNLGFIYGLLRFYEQSVLTHEQIVEALSGEQRELVVTHMISMRLSQGHRELARRLPGGPSRARKFYEMAWALQPDAGTNPATVLALSELGRAYEAETKVAAKAKDPVAMAEIHARFGIFPAAEQVLTLARNQLGRTTELRWVEARFVEELQGDDRSLQAAARHYEEILGRGERVVHALAGYARVLRRLGRGEEVLPRLLGYPDSSVQMRAVTIRILFDRLIALRPEEEEAAGEDWARIETLFRAALRDWEREDLLVEAAAVALGRADAKRLKKFTREHRRRAPQDLRGIFFEARIMELNGTPIHPEGE